jgi:hypothetical protein
MKMARKFPLNDSEGKGTRMNTWKTSRTALTLFALGMSLPAAGEEPGIHFQRGAWEIACDNTRTCRMAGYCSDPINGHCASVLMTRAAGPDTPLEGVVTLADYGREEPPYDGSLTLWIDGKAQGKLERSKGNGGLKENKGDYRLAPAQIRALRTAARRDGEIVFAGDSDSESFTLSGKGISAVLLKMDEFQGRVGTPGALIRRGDKSEASVLLPRPVPVIRMAKVIDAPSRVLAESEVAALKPRLLQSKGKEEECEFDDPESTEVSKFDLTPLDERHVLISTRCRLYASDASVAYWVMDSALEGTPRFLMTETGWYLKGRFHGVSDVHCPYISEGIWDGREFRPSAEWYSGRCHIVQGGAWYLPTLVTRVVGENGKELPAD